MEIHVLDPVLLYKSSYQDTWSGLSGSDPGVAAWTAFNRSEKMSESHKAKSSLDNRRRFLAGTVLSLAVASKSL